MLSSKILETISYQIYARTAIQIQWKEKGNLMRLTEMSVIERFVRRLKFLSNVNADA